MVFAGIEANRETLEHDEEWPSLLITESPERGLGYAPLNDFDTGEANWSLPEVAALIVELRCRMVALIGMGLRREGREEVLVVQIAATGEKPRVWLGLVMREKGHPPEIVEWSEETVVGEQAAVIQAAVDQANT